MRGKIQLKKNLPTGTSCFKYLLRMVCFRLKCVIYYKWKDHPKFTQAELAKVYIRHVNSRVLLETKLNSEIVLCWESIYNPKIPVLLLCTQNC